MKFELNENELNSYNEFLATLPEKFKKKTKRIIFKFTELGIVIIAKAGRIKTDITDYAKW